MSEYTREVPAQILYGFGEEMATTLEDVVLRRMLLGKSPSKGVECGRTLVRVLANYAGFQRGEAEDIVEEMGREFARRFMLNKTFLDSVRYI
jgi:glycerol-3-phosphate dehydrogenase